MFYLRKVNYFKCISFREVDQWSGSGLEFLKADELDITELITELSL